MEIGSASGRPESKRARFRRLLAQDAVTVAPGVFDGISTRLVEQAGFDVGYATGAGAAASMLGLPDLGMMGLADIADHVGRLAASTSMPLFCDADTGYGSIGSVIRTVELYEAAGVAGLHLEDQSFPKRCGHFPGKQVVQAEEFERLLKAALSARSDPDFVIAARTDARGPLGLDEAISRANRYADAGADLLFVEAPLSVEDFEAIGARVQAPKVANMISNSVTPVLTHQELTDLGFALAIYPIVALGPAAVAMQEALVHLAEDGHDRASMHGWSSIDLGTTMGLAEWSERIAEFEAR
ncbi:isocitrate lyase/PEP mutase family protein [Nonomuraea cavernae]|uniref:isocitrate lyase/PEP mutase family protein n=1 Tax=Nonomuraea cavernae TaxID=2045107 RepID=UPI0033C6D7AA